jgi:hypothetical protein
MKKIKLPKIKFTKPTLPKLTVDNVLRFAQYGTYAFIVIRILVYVGQQLSKLRFKAK